MSKDSQLASKSANSAIANENERQIKLVQTQREYAFHDMQILMDLSNNIHSDKSALTKFKARFKRIEKLRSEFFEYTTQINELKLILNPSENIDLKAVQAFDDLYYGVIGAADSILPNESVGIDTAHAARASTTIGACGSFDNHSTKPFSQVRLPKLELPKFDGNIEHWQTFFDTFSSLVHNNNSISSIEKFHYLLSCLSGQALSLAKGIPVTSENYPIVFDTLIDRFENKRVLAYNYLDKISNFSPLKNGNFFELRNLTNILNETVNALRAMKIKQLDEFILFYLASRVLDNDTRKRFEIQNSEQIPTFSDLLTFLQSYVKVLEVSQSGTISGSGTQLNQLNKITKRPLEVRTKNNYKSNSLPSSVANASIPNQYSVTCIHCGEQHNIFKCSKFQTLSIPEKNKIVFKQKLCKNCLRPNHNVNQCFSKSSCSVCGKRHHSLLHDGGGSAVAVPSVSCEVTDGSDGSSVIEPPFVKETSVTSNTHLGHSRAMVLLGTCIVRVRGYDPGCSTQPILARALIDSGAQDCFMTSSLAQRLCLPLRRCKLTVAGLGKSVVHQIKGETSCTVQPRNLDDPKFDINVIVLDKITSKMPSVPVPPVVRNNFKHLVLADTEFDRPTDIDLLLGAEQFHAIYDGQRLDLGKGLPVALHSVFGWVLTGRVDPVSRPPSTISSLVASTRELDDVVKRFWEVEEPPKTELANPEDVKCEELFTSLVSRKPDGRYVVPLLLKDPCETLGNSLTNAKSRLSKLEKRLVHSELSKDYGDFMDEYQNLGHMQPSSLGSGKFVIPHHCVVRPDSATTKLRVVFDASSKTTNGKSLNDIVYTGPKLQNDIVDILTKFRLQPIVFTADITKMYRNIDLRPEDRVWQHVLWRSSPSDPVSEYELNTVTYGVKSSPYLAIRTLHQLAAEHGSEYPKAAEVVRQDTFMDDITAGAPTVAQALQLKDQLINLLSCAQFELRKWSSNSPEFNASLPVEHCQIPKSFCDENHQHIIKILGVQWDPLKDFFTYSISALNSSFTKRAILSGIARIYDPVGWLAPVVLIAKFLLQELWRLNLGWDDTVPPDIANKWRNFLLELDYVKNITVPRKVTADRAVQHQLIGFCDGSSKAYGCCVYLRSVGPEECQAHLLIAKSKLAPIKPLTVNRLELCGAVLLARVLKHMHNLLKNKIPINQTIAFTDSSTVLSWLHIEPHKLKTFVAHRVVKITEDVPLEYWQHVSTRDNPADHCSRGLSSGKLAECASWWVGPDWLAKDISCWPGNSRFEFSDDIPELRPNACLAQATIVPNEPSLIFTLLERYSSLTRVQRILAWCLRFISASSRHTETSKTLTVKELDHSLQRLIKHEQQAYLTEDVQSSKAIQKLRPFVDDSGLLRVGGRLKHSNLPISAKHPVLLPKTSRLSLLIVDCFHITYLHCGPRTLQSIIQRKFWILGIRNLIRSRLSKCVQCFKAKPIQCQPLMGDLPSSRVQQTRCFQKVGIDFAGPFLVKESHRRKAKTYKVYVCIFVCLAVKAIHIEVVTELSTAAFIAALDRFVSRRGLCTFIVTDNGTNFIGAKRYLNELYKLICENRDPVSSNLAERGITWQLNPPTGSHFGGIFESGVKSMKYHLKRVIGSQILTLEELITVLAKVEAVLNSRPLCNISSDPDEVDILTPGHFLVTGPLVALPEPELTDQYVSPRERWQMLQKLTQSFWRIWQRDYLHTLQQRAKWFHGRANVRCGDIVLLVDNNLPPLEWRSGQVTNVHPGADGVVRVVTLRTTRGFLRRPVTKLCPLPIEH